MEYSSLSDSRYDCKYHLVIIPKRRKKSLIRNIRVHLKRVLSELAKQKESKILSGYIAL
jgi:putative transposase